MLQELSLNMSMTENSEIGLAEKLKSECFPNGKEKNPKVSAKILHHLALLYKSKSSEKHSLIQSVALLTSAILRHPNNVKEIQADLDETCLFILKLANATSEAMSLDTHVEKLKERISTFRQTTEQAIDVLTPIPDYCKGEMLREARNKKVKEVSMIGQMVAEMYADLMRDISDCCEELLGNPPCKFSLVGMGSLARQEVTPYSDFESIIVLEEGVQLMERYESVLDYFRWFATLFQILLVRLGETPLRFLTIPCLNHPTDPNRSWFYDAYTPCGIRPDGFAPAASKNPLGRKATSKKPSSVELIKPISEMVKYLNSDEDLKNGYHLADVLTKTCFVSGCGQVYKSFSQAVDEVMYNKTPNEYESGRFFNDIQSNLRNFGLFLKLGNSEWSETLDVKRLLYRSCTLFVSALGKWYGVREASCLEILEKLMESEVLTRDRCDQMKLSVAIACEVRLRFYIGHDGQNDIYLLEELRREQDDNLQKVADSVGLKALADSLVAANSAHESLHIFIKSSSFIPRRFVLTASSPLAFLDICHVLKMYCKVVEFCENFFLPDCYGLDEKERLRLLVTYGQNLLLVDKQDAAINVIKQNLQDIRNTAFTENSCRLYIVLAECLCAKKRYKEALKYIRKANKLMHFQMTDLRPGDVLLGYLAGMCFSSLRKYKKAVRWIQRDCSILEKMENTFKDNRFYKCFFLKARCLFNSENYEESRDILLKLQSHRLRLTENLRDAWMQSISNLLSLCRLQLDESGIQPPDCDFPNCFYERMLHDDFKNIVNLKSTIADRGEFDAKRVRNTHSNLKPLVETYKKAQEYFHEKNFPKAVSLLETFLENFNQNCISIHPVNQAMNIPESLRNTHLSITGMSRSLLVECFMELKLFEKALQQGRKCWMELSDLPWFASFTECKIRAVRNVGRCLLNMRRISESRLALEYAVELGLLHYENPVASPQFAETSASLITCYCILGIKSLPWSYEYTPSTFYRAFMLSSYHHATDDNSCKPSSSRRQRVSGKIKASRFRGEQSDVASEFKINAEHDFTRRLPLPLQQFLRSRCENLENELGKAISEALCKLSRKASENTASKP